MRTGTVRENQSRPWGTDPSYRQRRTLIDRIRHSDIKKRATSLWMVTYELKLMRRVSITKNDSTTNSVPRVTQGRRWMRRIFETALEPSHGFRSNRPWYGKNEMERQKNDSMRRRESSIDRSILAYLDFVREERFPRLRTAIPALFLPTKKRNW